MNEKKMVSREEFERALSRLAELDAEYTSLFERHIITESEPLREWVIKNHEEVERLSKVIEAYGKKEKS